MKEGFARCVDWSIATVTGGPEKLRSSEKQAKEKKIRLWTDYKPTSLMVRMWKGLVVVLNIADDGQTVRSELMARMWKKKLVKLNF